VDFQLHLRSANSEQASLHLVHSGHPQQLKPLRSELHLRLHSVDLVHQRQLLGLVFNPQPQPSVGADSDLAPLLSDVISHASH
jgi:hypothetical protein